MMFAALRERAAAQNALKRVWRDEPPPPEEPVPDSESARRAAMSAAVRAGRACFLMDDLYDAVRAVGRRVLVCPEPDRAAGDVAALCAMARDVCRLPVAVVAPAALADTVRARLAAVGVTDGELCEIGTRAAVVPDFGELADRIGAARVSSVIVVTCGLAPERTGVLASGAARTLIAVTDDRNAHAGAAAFSPPSLWGAFEAAQAAHRGPAEAVEASLRAAWAARGRRAWSERLELRGRECVVCMEPCARPCVSACCTGTTCAGCADRWIGARGTCPGCRSPADYTSVHCVTAG